MSLFLSYASPDKQRATNIYSRLTEHCDVFLDSKAIRGGAEWERDIDKAIRTCKVFAPVVTAASNASTWVTKETLLALNLNVVILPLLFSDNLPLRIVDRQFIDFRGSFEAGLSDLLSALSKYLGPILRSREETDSLIAKAIRYRIHGDIRAANAIVEQFVGQDSELASSGYVFWRKLHSSLDTDFAEVMGSQLLVRESTKVMENSPYGNRPGYDWCLELHGPNDALDAIDAVTYTLHPTFPNPIQKIRSREDHFRLQKTAWGRFTTQIHIDFIDYTALVLLCYKIA